MKRILITSVMAMLVLGCSVTAFAVDGGIDTRESIQETTVNFKVEPTYTFIIPATVELKLNEETKIYEGFGEVATEKIRLTKGATLDVAINSLNDFNLKTNEEAIERYSATVRRNNNPIVNNEVIAKFTTSEEKQSVFIDYKAEDPTFAGDYKDILTFNIKINKN